jgi:peptidyl-prolyl cis-trans isomerase SurA
MPRLPVRQNPIRRWLVTALLVAGVMTPGLARAQVVVVANGSPITAYDIEQRTKLIASSTHKNPSRQEVVQDLIDDRLKIDKAKTYGLVVSDGDVNEAFKGMATRQHITPEQFEQFLKRAGLGADTLKARIRAELTWGQLVRGKFSTSLEVAEPDIAQAMRARNEAETVGYIYTLYPVILVVPSNTQTALLEAKRREADNLRSRFLDCKEGLKLARALRDVAVREPITRSSADLNPQLRDLLANIQIGRLTAPEATAQGLQMFAVCDRKESKTESPVEREVKNQIFQRRFERESKKFLEEIRRGAMIEYKDPQDAKAK